VYLEEGCNIESVLIHGRRQDYVPMSGTLPEKVTVGVFLCKDVNEDRLRVLVTGLLGHSRVARVHIRPHPKNLWVDLDKWIVSLGNPRLCRSEGTSVRKDLEATDIVLGGNSTILVDAVTSGRLAGFVSGLDYGSSDLHQLVARGLVYPIESASDFDPESMLRFYRQPDWLSVLQQFANINADHTEIAIQFGEEITKMLSWR
jgi:hypothetical protein